MILLAAEDEAYAAQAYNAGHHADAAAGVFQMRALFNVRLDKTSIAFARQAQARHAGKTCVEQGIGQPDAAIVDGRMLHARRQRPGQRAAAETADEPCLFVLE
jgi:hypothetical protein